MLKRLSAVLALTLFLTLTTGVAAQAYEPQGGAAFNNPWGGATSKERLIKKFVLAVNNSRKGSTIKVATYSNDRKDIADSLIRAKKRGVSVQMLLNDNWTSRQTRRLRKALGTNIEKSSFLRVCNRSCRGRRGNLHSKFYLFSKTGSAGYVTMMGSANLTGYGARNQWNDMFTVKDNKPMYNAYAQVFNEMKRDRAMGQPYRSYTVRGGYDINFYPRYNTNRSNDPVMGRLSRIRCTGASGPTGIGNKTLIRISMYGWNGQRGRYLADKVASLSRNGCNIRVLHSDGGGYVVKHLRANGVPVRTASYDRNRDGEVDMYTHQKYMILSGNYNKKAAWHVWTGSQNWSDIALHGDEVTMHIPRRGAFAAYRKNFDFIWKYHSHVTG